MVHSLIQQLERPLGLPIDRAPVGVSIVGEDGQNGNNPDAKIWVEINWSHIPWIVLSFRHTPFKKPGPPSRQEMAEQSGEAAAEITSDKKIIEETTGNPEVSGPENQTIVKSFYGKGKYSLWKGQEG